MEKTLKTVFLSTDSFSMYLTDFEVVVLKQHSAKICFQFLKSCYVEIYRTNGIEDLYLTVHTSFSLTVK